MFKSKRNKLNPEVKWENWRKIPTRASPRVKYQELVRKINKKHVSVDFPSKKLNNVLEVQSRKLLASSSDQNWGRRDKRTLESRSKDPEDANSILKDLPTNDCIHKHFVNKISSNSNITKIKLEIERPKVEILREVENNQSLLEAKDHMEEFLTFKKRFFERKRNFKSFDSYRSRYKHLPMISHLLNHKLLQ